MTTRIIGDVHRKFDRYKKIVNNSPYRTLQLGDMICGFPGEQPPVFGGKDHRWFRGNHDNPAFSKVHPNYAVDYGMFWGLFIIAGAWSIDSRILNPGVNWWPDEQLSVREMQKALELYEKEKPEKVITHDCPIRATEIILEELKFRGHFDLHDKKPRVYPNSTSLFLDHLLDIHTPKLWVFGHWHISHEFEINGCKFVCVPELGTYDIED